MSAWPAALLAAAPEPTAAEARAQARDILSGRRYTGTTVDGPFHDVLDRIGSAVRRVGDLIPSLDGRIPGGRGITWLVLIAYFAFGETAAGVTFAAGIFAAVVIYDVVFEVRSAGATPGKRALGIRVLLEDGAPVGLRASAIRNVIRLIEGFALLYIPAFIAVLATRRNQRLGDLAAGTVVARAAPEAAAPFWRPPSAGEYADWDVSAITPEELAAVRSFLGRRSGFEPSARYQIAASLARKLGPKVSGGPPYDGQPERFLEQLESAKSARM